MDTKLRSFEIIRICGKLLVSEKEIAMTGTKNNEKEKLQAKNGLLLCAMKVYMMAMVETCGGGRASRRLVFLKLASPKWNSEID